MRKIIISFLILLPGIVVAIPLNVRINLEKSTYYVNSNQTYKATFIDDATLLTQRGIKEGQRAQQTFFPKTERLKLIEAYVILPDGQKIKATKKNIFTRPSQATESAPGFTNSLTTTVVFPQLQPGSRTYVKWSLQLIKPETFGFNLVDAPDFRSQVVKQVIEVNAPKTLKLHWAKRGAYKISVKQNKNEQTITATLTNKPQAERENYMVSPVDVLPVFAMSTLSSWQEVGEIYWKKSRSRIIVTPKIYALANRIVGNKKGIQAAQLLYNWVAQNIHYVAVYLNAASGYVPHKTSEILHNGYGDCKDHVALLEALLEAEGIDSETVLISAGKHFSSLPIPSVYEFNHVITYLPKYKIFTDPTVRSAAFGSLMLGEAGKFVVIAGKKSYATRMPLSISQKNRYLLNNSIKILENGDVSGKNILRFFGYFNTIFRRVVSVGASRKRIANSLLSRTPEGGTGMMTTSNPSNLMKPMVAKGAWLSPYAVHLDARTFFSTPIGIDAFNPHTLRNFITPGKRKYPIIVGAATYRWHYEITTPKYYQAKLLPHDIHFKNKIGQYDSVYKIVKNKIDVTRTLIINKDVYSIKEYPALLALLYKPINDARSIMTLGRAGFVHYSKMI